MIGGRKTSSTVNSQEVVEAQEAVEVKEAVEAKEAGEVTERSVGLAEQLRTQIAQNAAFLYVFEAGEASTIPAGMLCLSHAGSNGENGYITLANGNPEAGSLDLRAVTVSVSLIQSKLLRAGIILP